MHIKSIIALCSVSAGLLLSGCQTYQARTEDLQAAFKGGNLATSLSEAQKQYNKNLDSKDTVIAALELATVQRSAALALHPVPVDPKKKPAATADGAPAAEAEPLPSPKQFWTKASLDSFEAARVRMQKFIEEAKVSLGNETAAMFTNLDNLPYKGKAHDAVMAHTYTGLNYLFLGQPDNTRVALNRVLQAQRDAVELNSKRIEAAQKEAEESARKAAAPAQPGGKQGAQGYDSNRALQDPGVSAQVAALEQEFNTLTSDAYSNYVNPFSVFLDGLFFVTHAEGASDLERARKSFERVAGMSRNPYTEADLAMANDAANGKLPENLTYVIFETGSAPHFDQIKIDIPLFIVGSGRVPYTGAAFPKLKTNNDFISALDVHVGEQTLRTETICSMDAVVAQTFKNEWPTILTKTLIATGVKATTSYMLNKAAEDQNAYAGLFMKIATGIANYAVTIADTRSWTSLPKQFQYCRFATPANRTISLSVPTAGGLVTKGDIVLPEGKVVLVYVKNMRPGQPLFVDSITLLP